MSLTDAYRSLYEASHGGLANKVRVEFVELDSENFGQEEFKQALTESMVFLYQVALASEE